MDHPPNPSMVILARESRGLTQSELAEKASMPQARISKIESGLIEPTKETLERLATALDYPESFFFQREELYGIDTSILFHRKRMATPVKALRRIRAIVNIRRIHSANLLRAAEILHEIEFPYYDIEEFEGGPEDIAQALRATWRLPSGPIQNVTRAIENAGGIVIKLDLGTQRVDAVSQRIAGLPPFFFVDENTCGDRLRFSLAHELGHVVMHKAVTSTTIEDEADRFAAAFLMPANDIRDFLYDISIEKLAILKPLWKVAMAALLYRAKDLGRIDGDQSRRMWRQFSKAGWRRREPESLDIPQEEPRLLGELVERHTKDLGYSVKELAGFLCLNDHEVRTIYLGERAPLRAIPGKAKG